MLGDPAVDSMHDDVVETGQIQLYSISDVKGMQAEISNAGAVADPLGALDVLRHEIDAVESTFGVGCGKNSDSQASPTTEFTPGKCASPIGRLNAPQQRREIQPRRRRVLNEGEWVSDISRVSGGGCQFGANSFVPAVVE